MNSSNQHANSERIKKRVKSFWEAHPCGTAFTDYREGTKEFFDSIEEHRYRTHRYIAKLVDSAQPKGKRILEVGCGVGTDLRQFARAGGKVTALELNESSLRLAKRGFELFDSQGNFLIGDGENLGFKDNTFDLVYSLGVLHHTPNTQRAIDEIYRVLKPGGAAIVMLYYRYSFAFISVFLQAKFHRKLKGITVQELLNQASDGLDNPLTKVYSKREAQSMFYRFTSVKTCVRYLRRGHVPRIGRFIPLPLLNLLGRFLGWHLLIKAVK